MNQQPDKLLPALYGGIIMGLLSAVPFLNLLNCLCCAGIIIGGVSAVYFYKNSFTPDTPPFSAGDCLMVGALAGFFGAVVGTGLSLLFDMVFGNIMLEFLRNILLNSDLEISGDTRDQLEEALTEHGRPAALVAVQYFFALMLDMIFGLLGGLIGYGIFKPKVSAIPSMPKPM